MQNKFRIRVPFPALYAAAVSIFIINISCNREPAQYEVLKKDAALNPDYTSVTVPPNIAPLNFEVKEYGERYRVKFYNGKNVEFIVPSENGIIEIPRQKWENLLSSSVSGEYYIDIYARRSGKWEKYNTITNSVVSDSIDNYLVYRLIEPGFETWNKMGIYQRNLGNFRETPVMLNRMSDGNCMNCHAFSNNNSGTMMFHMRGENAGTVISREGKLIKINSDTEETISAGVYPSWHPSGDFIAFSVNNIVQNFHSVPGKKIEVFDTLSNIIVYDANNNIITDSRALADPDRLETFPTWSPDGRYLYYCSAVKQPLDRYDQIRYDLFRTAFDPDNLTFGETDTVLSVSGQGKSIAFPRISPDGRYLLYCLADYGNFTIWHPESDLWLLDLTTGISSGLTINSDETESYHMWSSTGRWIVFSSRREDGLYTRPWFSYFDSSGTAHKPFILPQRDPVFYFSFMKSYNIPELVSSRVPFNPRKLSDITKSDPVEVVYHNSDQ